MTPFPPSSSRRGMKRSSVGTGPGSPRGQKLDRLATACTADHSCFRLSDAPAHTGKKTRTAEPVVSENGKDAKQSFPLNPCALESWKDRQCPVRSSERWRDRQRALKQKSSLPDVRHQIALYLMRLLI